MRFVILTQYFPPEIGAPQARLAALARQLTKRGHDVEVVTAMPNYPHGRIMEGYRRRPYVREVIDGSTVHRVWIFAAMGRGLSRLISYLSFTAMCVIGLARCRRPDVVLVESPPLFAGVPGIVVARIWRAAAVMNIADLWPDAAVELGAVDEGLAVRAAHYLEHTCYDRADVVNAATEGLAEVIRTRTRSPEKVVLLPNGVDIEQFTPDGGNAARAAALGLPPERLFIHAGTMSYIHGLENVITAFATRPDDTLALIGTGSHQASLEALVATLELDNVRFVAPLSLAELSAVLPLATGAVVSVRDIPQARLVRPSKLFPAMACGLPILYAGEGEGADLVRRADCGVVAPNSDPEAIAEALGDLGAAPRSIGMNGRRWVEANLTWDRIVDTWLTTVQGRLEARRT